MARKLSDIQSEITDSADRLSSDLKDLWAIYDQKVASIPHHMLFLKEKVDEIVATYRPYISEPSLHKLTCLSVDLVSPGHEFKVYLDRHDERYSDLSTVFDYSVDSKSIIYAVPQECTIADAYSVMIKRNLFERILRLGTKSEAQKKAEKALESLASVESKSKSLAAFVDLMLDFEGKFKTYHKEILAVMDEIVTDQNEEKEKLKAEIESLYAEASRKKGSSQGMYYGGSRRSGGGKSKGTSSKKTSKPVYDSYDDYDCDEYGYCSYSGYSSSSSSYSESW